LPNGVPEVEDLGEEGVDKKDKDLTMFMIVHGRQREVPEKSVSPQKNDGMTPLLNRK